MQYRPDGLLKRGLSALLLLLAIALGVHLAEEWLAPLVPALIVLLVLGGLYAFVFRRR